MRPPIEEWKKGKKRIHPHSVEAQRDELLAYVREFEGAMVEWAMAREGNRGGHEDTVRLGDARRALRVLAAAIPREEK